MCLELTVRRYRHAARREQAAATIDEATRSRRRACSHARHGIG